jgi:hypothetical protein
MSEATFRIYLDFLPMLQLQDYPLQSSQEERRAIIGLTCKDTNESSIPPAACGK